MSEECWRCIAETEDGEQCKRAASCDIGCENMCKQHAKKYGGKLNKTMTTCQEPKLPKCKLYEKQPQFPCQLKKTSLWSIHDKETLGYNQKTNPVPAPQLNRSQLAQQSTEKWAMEPSYPASHVPKLRWSGRKDKFPIPNREDAYDEYLSEEAERILVKQRQGTPIMSYIGLPQRYTQDTRLPIPEKIIPKSRTGFGLAFIIVGTFLLIFSSIAVGGTNNNDKTTALLGATVILVSSLLLMLFGVTIMVAGRAQAPPSAYATQLTSWGLLR